MRNNALEIPTVLLPLLWRIYEDDTPRIHPTTALLISTTTSSTTSPSPLLILFFCCSCVVSSRTFSKGKVRQALTSYLLVHLTNSTTLTAYIQWYSTRRFRNFLLFTSSEDPLPRSPTHCRRAVVSKDTSSLDQPLSCTNSLPPPLGQRRRIFKLSCTAYGV